MSCHLEHSTTGKEDYLAETGSRVTVALKGPAGSKARILHIRYGSEEVDPTPPFQFDVKRGARILTVLVEASKPGVMLQLIEVCGGGKRQVISRFHYDPMGPARGYIIRGKKDA